MPNREKVIKGLEVCRDQDNPPGYRFTSCVDNCPYHGNGCSRKLKEDALDLLKEQQQQIWEFQDQVEYLTDKQKEQKFFVDSDGKITPLPVVVRCKDCMKRNTVLCIQEEAGNINNQDDWFCADGERKEGR